MSNKIIDKAKGRAREAAGVLTGSRRLKSEGRAEQAKGSAKDTADKVIDTFTDRKTD
jgi:uncharacterized protein YjbJ (UPF0337 family)